MPLKLLVGIRHFKNHQLEKEKTLLDSLSKGQSPVVVFITCSDSRIDPHLFTHSGLGTLFVGRNPGNIIAPYDPSIPSGGAATVEYGLKPLNVNEIIICGHSSCGAMEGLLTPDLDKNLPATAAWLNHSRLLVEHLDQRHPKAVQDFSLKIKRLAKDNILLQMEHLKTHPSVKDRLKENTLKIHGWYYDIKTGEVYIYNAQKNRFISFEQTVEELALEKLNQIVASEVLNYFTRSLESDSVEYFSLVSTYRKVRFIGVSPVWEDIKQEVENKLRREIGELYVTKNNEINPLFDELLNRGAAIRLKNFEGIGKVFAKSPHYTTPHSVHGDQRFYKEELPELSSISVPAPRSAL